MRREVLDRRKAAALPPLVAALAVIGAGLVGCEQPSEADRDTESPARIPDTYETGSTDVRDVGTDTATTCEKTVASMPADPDRTLLAARADSPTPSVTVDGQFEEAAYGYIPGVTFDGASNSSDNDMSIRALWTPEALVVAFAVEDTDLEVSSEAEVYENDGVEMLVDATHGEHDEMTESDYHFLAAISGGTKVLTGTPDGQQPTSDVRFDHETRRTSSGYRLEMRIPWDEIDVDPESGRRLGLLLVNNDRDGGGRAWYSWGNVHPFNVPSKWGDLRLAEATCSDSPPRDTGVPADTRRPSDTRPDGGAAETGPDGASDTSPAPKGRTYTCDGWIRQARHGGSQIDAALDRLSSPDQTVCFEPGIYKIDHFRTRADGLKWIGGDVRLVPTSRNSETDWLEFYGDDWIVDGFAFDYGDVEFPPKIVLRGGGWTFENVVFRGVHDSCCTQEHSYTLSLGVTDPDTEGLFRNVYMPEGSAEDPSKGSSHGGIYAGPWSTGTLRIDGVWMENWAENTIYTQYLPGRLIIENSFFRNTNVAGTRVGANTILRNNTYLKTGTVPAQYWSGGTAMRGVWVDGHHDRAGQTGDLVIEDCDFHFVDADGGRTGVIVTAPPEGKLVVRDTRIRHDFRHAIWTQDRKSDHPTDLQLDGLHVTGSTNHTALELASSSNVVGTPRGCVSTNGPVSNRASVRNNMASSNCDAPDTDPPMSPPPPRGQTPRPLPDKQ